MIFADLHIHSKHSRGCSKNISLELLEKYARIKGLGLLGTGDFTHPEWIKVLKKLDDKDGFLYTKTGFPFVLQTEISLMYRQDGKGRRVHLIVLAPSLDVVDQITEALLAHGRVDYDGRPIFNITCPDFVYLMRTISKDIEVIPAHIWTSWFSLFGAKSGFDSIQDCFGDQTGHIHALETGLSSDPPMNWRLKQLDGFNLVSFSDSHSYWPWRIGRECTMFDIKMKYKALLKAIRTGNGLQGTIEVEPSFGKYHYTGHRKCNICLTPLEAMKEKGVCPGCGKALTVGVAERVEMLADRRLGYRPERAKPFQTLLPLSEIIAISIGAGVGTKKVSSIYMDLTKRFSGEIDLMITASLSEIKDFVDKALYELIKNNRDGKLMVEPGYDGVSGRII